VEWHVNLWIVDQHVILDLDDAVLDQHVILDLEDAVLDQHVILDLEDAVQDYTICICCFSAKHIYHLRS
jgi:hypothetical protein